MRARVFVTLKPSVFDPQGQTIADALHSRPDAIDQLRRMPEHHRYLRGLRSWVGFRQTGIPVRRGARHSGGSKYSLLGLVKLAADGIFAFSIVPIRAAALHGEMEAVDALIRRGARIDLPVAAALGRVEDLRRLLPASNSDDRHLALDAVRRRSHGHLPVVDGRRRHCRRGHEYRSDRFQRRVLDDLRRQSRLGVQSLSAGPRI